VCSLEGSTLYYAVFYFVLGRGEGGKGVFQSLKKSYFDIKAFWGLGKPKHTHTHSSCTGHFVYTNDTDLQLDSVTACVSRNQEIYHQLKEPLYHGQCSVASL